MASLEDYPRTLSELERRFSTAEACREYLAALRWPEDFVCPRCGRGHAWPLARGLFQCAACHAPTAVTAGTILEGTRKPLRLWFRAMWYVTSQKNGVGARGRQRVLGRGSYETAGVWLHQLRRAMVRPGRDRLQGAMEVDESDMGGERHGGQDRGAVGKTLVLVAAEEEGTHIGRIRLLRNPNLETETMTAAVSACVQPGSRVHTDGLASSAGLSAAGYRHRVTRVTAAPPGEEPLPRVHRVVSLLKRWMLGTHQGAIRPSHLDYYLDEFSFRFNRRTSRGKLFYRRAQQMMAVDPLPQAQLRGGRKYQITIT